MQFTRKEIAANRDAYAQLTRNELEMVRMGVLSVLVNVDSQAGGSHKKQHSRKRVRTSLSHHAKPICRDTFLFLHGITNFRFRAVQNHYLQHGLRGFRTFLYSLFFGIAGLVTMY